MCILRKGQSLCIIIVSLSKSYSAIFNLTCACLGQSTGEVEYRLNKTFRYLRELQSTNKSIQKIILFQNKMCDVTRVYTGYTCFQKHERKAVISTQRIREMLLDCCSQPREKCPAEGQWQGFTSQNSSSILFLSLTVKVLRTDELLE